MQNIIFQCRKCMHQLIVEVPDKMTKEELMQKFRKVSNLECPNCGEEPYENWVLLQVD